MLIQGLCGLLLGEAAKSAYTKQVSESLLCPWKEYTQSSQDLQKALHNAFRHTSAAIALALTPGPRRASSLPCTKISPQACANVMCCPFAETIAA